MSEPCDDWFKSLQLPYFLAIVDKSTCIMSVYTAAMAKLHFIEVEYRGIKFLLKGALPNSQDSNGIRITNFGLPLLSMSIHDIADKNKLDKYYKIIKTLIQVEESNRSLLRLRSMKRLKWDTNEIP